MNAKEIVRINQMNQVHALMVMHNGKYVKTIEILYYLLRKINGIFTNAIV